ncbi:uncharacterized protein LOC108152513 isoform X1 [Drosophila miranda]|uniref:uncharacterized protein LOC108152513 isoform X1 n=1 Tax=Drosophila miranda TaxID=7229 RepID=UPI0007E725FF|nr:uncharacterized protein LOC108152513 isoform X1 [Drosophila miranda]
MPHRRKCTLRKCCFCISLYCGSILIAFYTIMSGLLNAATLADDIIFRKNLSSDNWVKWFNVSHVCLMIAAAVILLVAVMTNHILSIQIWMGLFVVHIIGYYIAYHAMINVRNPFFSSALSTALYVLVILLTLAIDIYCLIVVYSRYNQLKNPQDYMPKCVDRT